TLRRALAAARDAVPKTRTIRPTLHANARTCDTPGSGNATENSPDGRTEPIVAGGGIDQNLDGLRSAGQRRPWPAPGPSLARPWLALHSSPGRTRADPGCFWSARGLATCEGRFAS